MRHPSQDLICLDAPSRAGIDAGVRALASGVHRIELSNFFNMSELEANALLRARRKSRRG